MEQKNGNKKIHTMQYYFLKEKFLVYLCTFLLPILLLGMIFVLGVYFKEKEQVRIRMNNSLEMAENYLNGFYADADAFQIFLGSGQRMGQFYRTFQNEKMDYDSMNAIRYLSAYMLALKSGSADMESVYFYLDNKERRLLTSENMITSVNRLGDEGWVDVLLRMKGKETKVMRRVKTSKQEDVVSVFRRFANYRGGVVLNYQADSLCRNLRQMAFYEGQCLAVYDKDGKLLFSNMKAGEETLNAAGIYAENQKNGKVSAKKLFGDAYLTESMTDASQSLTAVTVVPHKIVNQVFWSDMKALLLLTIFITGAAALLAYDRASRNYSLLRSIVEIFERVEKKQPLPEEPQLQQKRNIYGHILQNIIRTFLENSYLQMQLSERKYRQAAAQMLALQYQVNPHFLFNTLQAINYEVLSISDGEQKNANRMIENLSDILRYSLHAAKEEASIRDEIEVCKKYIEIQKIRQGSEFHAEWEIDPEAEDAYIQRMLLQPLLENALSHGIRYTAGGRVRVRADRRGERLRFRVIDSGEGIDAETIGKLREKLRMKEVCFDEEHIGLQNVNERLVLAYGEDARLHIWSKQGMGTIVSFEIEMRKRETDRRQ